MAGGGSAGEKTEKPTQKRVEDARKKGTVAKSMDLTGSLTILALLLIMPFIAQQFGTQMIQAFKATLQVPSTVLSPQTSLAAAWTSFQPGLLALAAVLGCSVIVGAGVGFAQVGVKLTPEALTPKFEVLDPSKGLKRLLSKRSLFEAGKALFKGVVFGWIAYAAIRESYPALIKLVWAHPGELAAVVGGLIVTIGTRIGAIWLVLAILDYFFQRFQTQKDLMMTKDEVKREYKEQEGSPEVKAARMQRMRQLSKGRGMDAVKTADVIVTNPTHYAVAIKYDREKMHAPMVVAKGVDYLALRIRETAEANKVPIIPNPPLARALYKQCEVGDFVPRDLFAPVAEVLAFVYRTLKKVRQ